MSTNLAAAENLAQAIRQVARDEAAELWGIMDRELKRDTAVVGGVGVEFGSRTTRKAAKGAKGFCDFRSISWTS